MSMRTKMKPLKKVIISAAAILLIGILALIVVFFDVFRTAASITKINTGPSYEMNYYGGYALNQYLKQGAGSADELRSFLVDNLAKGASDFAIGKHGCSAFFAKTPDGDLILARNLDTPIGEGCVLKTDNTEGSRILAVSNLAWIFDKQKEIVTLADKGNVLAAPYVITDGMNEYGLAVAYFMAAGSEYSSDKDKVTICDHASLAALLNKAKTVDEAVSLLSKYNLGIGNFDPLQFMICDAAGKSAVIEFVDGKMQVINMDGNYQICTNFILYNNPSLTGFGSDRYKNYDAVLSKSGGVISTEDALKLLQKNTIPGDEQWSVVYNLTKKTLSATFYGYYDDVHTYSLK
ncbi:MAG: linear amide C-N hydrolase [Bacillota bacterium]|nr:linear amide C-N hydrolase [Bacillota bacterium]